MAASGAEPRSHDERAIPPEVAQAGRRTDRRGPRRRSSARSRSPPRSQAKVGPGDRYRRLGFYPDTTGHGRPAAARSKAPAIPTFKALFNSWKKLDQLQDGVIAIPSDKPVKTNVSFTSGFGVRSDPFHAGAAMHPGIDLAGAYGTPIYATADGTVLRAGWNSGGYGNLVELDHGRGIITRYGHMSAVLVHAGDHVTRGQQIGRMGSTGRSTGNHLHYEVRIDGRAVNPIPFMKSTDYVLAMQKRAAPRRWTWRSAARSAASKLAARLGAPYLAVVTEPNQPDRQTPRSASPGSPSGSRSRRSCGLPSTAAAAPVSPTSSSLPRRQTADDAVAETDGVKLVVDPVSLDLVKGSAVDFVEDLGGAASRSPTPTPSRAAAADLASPSSPNR